MLEKSKALKTQEFPVLMILQLAQHWVTSGCPRFLFSCPSCPTTEFSEVRLSSFPIIADVTGRTRRFWNPEETMRML